MRRQIAITLAAALATCATAHAQWMPTSGPQGAPVQSMVVDDDRLIAAIRDDVYHFESDEWRKVGAIPSLDPITWNRHGELVMVGDMLLTTRHGHLMRSTDYGVTWSSVGVNDGVISTDGSVFYMVVHDPNFVNPPVIRRSTDGLSWDAVGEMPHLSGTLVFFNDDIYTLVGYSTNLSRSEDGGRTWNDVQMELRSDREPSGTITARQIGSTSEALYIYADGEVFSSADGRSVKNITGNLPDPLLVRELFTSNDEVYITTEMAETYRYNGTSWDRIELKNVRDIYVGDDEAILLTYTDGIFQVEENATKPKSITNGLTKTAVMAVGAIGETVIANASGAVHRTTNGGLTWDNISAFDSWMSVGFHTHGNRIYAMAGGIYRSLDSGATWEIFGPKYDFEFEDRHNYYGDLTDVETVDNTIYLGVARYLTGKGASGWADGGVYRSDDNGTTWERAENGLPYGAGFVAMPVHTIAALDNNVVVTGASGVYRSINRGDMWMPAMNGIQPQDLEYTASVHKLGDKFYLMTRYNMYESSDRGASWTLINSPMQDGYIWNWSMFEVGDALFMQSYKDDGSASYDYKLFEFNGTEWRDATDDQPEGVQFGSMVRAGEYYYAGTGDGVWKLRRPLSVGTTDVADNESGVGSMEVTSYPNPANGATDVVVTVAKSGDARAVLTNTLGEEVAVLHEGRVNAGENRFSFDASDLPSGTYFVRLNAEGTERVGRIVIAR